MSKKEQVCMYCNKEKAGIVDLEEETATIDMAFDDE